MRPQYIVDVWAQLGLEVGHPIWVVAVDVRLDDPASVLAVA
jgi:hypothetical protein